MGRSAWALLPEVADDVTKISGDNLPPLHAQFYEQGTDRRLYFNINGTVSYISLTNATESTNPTSIPSGLIAMWKGSVATIPTGWGLCNGENGTPDLRDKFIVGAKQDSDNTAKTNISGSLTQTGGAATHTHDVGTYATSSHTHSLARGAGGYTVAGGTIVGAETAGGSLYTLAGGAGASAVTDATTNVGGSMSGASASASSLPTYYALCFIMKF